MPPEFGGTLFLVSSRTVCRLGCKTVGDSREGFRLAFYTLAPVFIALSRIAIPRNLLYAGEAPGLTPNVAVFLLPHTLVFVALTVTAIILLYYKVERIPVAWVGGFASGVVLFALHLYNNDTTIVLASKEHLYVMAPLMVIGGISTASLELSGKTRLMWLSTASAVAVITVFYAIFLGQIAIAFPAVIMLIGLFLLLPSPSASPTISAGIQFAALALYSDSLLAGTHLEWIYSTIVVYLIAVVLLGRLWDEARRFLEDYPNLLLATALYLLIIAFPLGWKYLIAASLLALSAYPILAVAWTYSPQIALAPAILAMLSSTFIAPDALVEKMVVFLATAALTSGAILLSRASTAAAALIAISIALTAPFWLPPDTPMVSSCNVNSTVDSVNSTVIGSMLPYNVADGLEGLKNIIAGNSGLIENISSTASQLSGDPYSYRIIEGRTEARIVAPGIVSQSTLVDLSEGENITFTPPTGFLLFDLTKPVNISYAVEPGDQPIFRAAIIAENVVVPRVLLGNLTFSPSHNVLLLNFSDPMIIEARSYRLHLNSIVFASLYLVAGHSNITEDVFGPRFDRAVIGVVEGQLIDLEHGSTAPIPATLTKQHLKLYNLMQNLENETPSLYWALSALPEAAQKLNGLREQEVLTVNVPPALQIKAKTSLGNLYTLYYSNGKTEDISVGYYDGIDLCTLHIGLQPLRGPDKSPVDAGKVYYLQEVLENPDIPVEAKLAYAYELAGPDDMGVALWLAANTGGPGQNQGRIEIQVHHYYALTLLIPFIAGTAVWIESIYLHRKRIQKQEKPAVEEE